MVLKNKWWLFLGGFILLAGCGRTLEEQSPQDGGSGQRVVDSSVFRIAFGSCNKGTLEQPLWDVIGGQEPDLWVWLGDIVYGDTEDMEVLRGKYQRQWERAEYQAFIKNVPVVGVWDDHDYGVNNGGQEYPKKAESQQVLLDFLREPDDSLRRKRKGVYESYVYGSEGRRVKLILLDTRYHREAPGGNGDVLGDEQWRWLEKELGEGDAEVCVIGSSIQFLASEQPYEKWANFPKARKRLMELLVGEGVPPVIFISGDRHLGEISAEDVEGLGYRLYDITSSGMTHSYGGAEYARRSVRFLKGGSFKEINTRRLGDAYGGIHFGMLRFEWGDGVVEVLGEIRNEVNEVCLQEVVKLPLR